jgi:segregation and condensation protein B
VSEQALETAAERGSREDDAAAIADAGDDQSIAVEGAADSPPDAMADDAPDALADEALDALADEAPDALADEAAASASDAPIDAEQADPPASSGEEPVDAPVGPSTDADRPDGEAEDAEADGAAGQASLELADPARLRGALEAVLLVVDEPVSTVSLAQTLAVPPPDVQAGLAELRDEYEREGRGIDLREVAGGWRMYSREDYAEYVERFVLDGQRTRLTQAALETLAVIAYRQPVARSRVSAIRGVGVDGVMRTLITRGLIAEAGLDPESGAGLFVTTPLFLEKLGLNSLDELPPLGPLLPDHTDLDAEQDVDTDLVRPPTRSSGAEADQPPIDVSADD